MFSSSSRVVRYARAWLGGPAPLERVERALDRGDRAVPATVLRSANRRTPKPTWVVLHGMTAAGREHAQLSRFARTLASSGAVVVLPEVPEWRELRLIPSLAAPTVRASIDGVRALRWNRGEPVGVIGFSFGAPHAIACAGHQDVTGEVGAVAGFGGYCDLDSTFSHMMGGSAQADETEPPNAPPDPYGRWIVAANFLPHTDLAGASEVGAALRALAIHASTLSAPAWESDCEPLRGRVRLDLDPAHRALFDRVAPPAGQVPPPDEGRDLASRLVRAARRVTPSIDPRDALGRVRTPVHILHGRSDRLIPWSEAAKIQQALDPSTPSRLTVTRLFGHSTQDPLGFGAIIRETPPFASALRALLGAI